MRETCAAQASGRSVPAVGTPLVGDGQGTADTNLGGNSDPAGCKPAHHDRGQRERRVTNTGRRWVEGGSFETLATVPATSTTFGELWGAVRGPRQPCPRFSAEPSSSGIPRSVTFHPPRPILKHWPHTSTGRARNDEDGRLGPPGGPAGASPSTDKSHLHAQGFLKREMRSGRRARPIGDRRQPVAPHSSRASESSMSKRPNPQRGPPLGLGGTPRRRISPVGRPPASTAAQRPARHAVASPRRWPEPPPPLPYGHSSPSRRPQFNLRCGGRCLCTQYG